MRLEAEVALENFHEGVALQCATQPAVLCKRQRQGRAIQSWWLRRRRGKSKGTTAGQVRAGQEGTFCCCRAKRTEQRRRGATGFSVSSVSDDLSQCRALNAESKSKLRTTRHGMRAGRQVPSEAIHKQRHVMSPQSHRTFPRVKETPPTEAPSRKPPKQGVASSQHLPTDNKSVWHETHLLAVLLLVRQRTRLHKVLHHLHLNTSTNSKSNSTSNRHKDPRQAEFKFKRSKGSVSSQSFKFGSGARGTWS